MKNKVFEARQSCHIPGVRSFKAGERIKVVEGDYMHRMMVCNPYFSVVVVEKEKPAKKSGRRRRIKKSRGG